MTKKKIWFLHRTPVVTRYYDVQAEKIKLTGEAVQEVETFWLKLWWGGEVSLWVRLMQKWLTGFHEKQSSVLF